MNLPKYLTINHYLKIKDIEQIKTPTDVIKLITAVTDTTEEEVLQLSKEDIDTVSEFITNLLDKSKPKFWPVFEHEGIAYGFQPVSKMILGEWIDMDNFSKDWKNNLHHMTAVVYRPITKHNHKSWAWRTNYNLKVWAGNNDTSPFDVYEVEPYDSSTVNARAKLFKELPLEIAKGMLSFFLVLGIKQSESIQTSLLKTEEEKKIVVQANQNLIQQLYQTTTDGF